MFKNFLKLTFKGIRYRKLRSWLTILGIVIGITLVVVIFALSGGIQEAVSKNMQSFGTDMISIIPGKETNPLAGLFGAQKFKISDLEALEEIDGVDYVAPMDWSALNVEFKGEKKSVMVYAGPWKEMSQIYEKAQGVGLEKGEWPKDDQESVAVVAYLTARSLFKSKVNIGDEIVIKSKKFKVVGSITEVGNQMDDNTIYISLEHYRNMTGIQGAGTAMVMLKPDANIKIIEKQIKYELSKQEVISDFSVITAEKAKRLAGNVLDIIELGLIVIAFISLIVGAVGIMNTMYTSVLERTKQIGIMKAIGATNDAILSLFLIESGIIGLMGGLIGTGLGLLSAYLIGSSAGKIGVANLFSWEGIDFTALAAVLVVTFIVGVLAGVLPARTASKLEPAQALRYE
jgi:putative ABC transport system permease protein